MILPDYTGNRARLLSAEERAWTNRAIYTIAIYLLGVMSGWAMSS